MYQLNTRKLRTIAHEHGDHTSYAIAKRTGITTAHRILSGATQPDLNSALRLSHTYGFDLRDLMDRVDTTQPAT